jgi:N-acetyl-S-(2-succino)cysteine monooxygenase
VAEPARQMKLGYFLFPTGHHVAAWRHPDGSPRSAIDFKAFVHQIKSAESAKFDMGFLADNDAFAGGGGRTIEEDLDALSRTSIRYTAQSAKISDSSRPYRRPTTIPSMSRASSPPWTA